MIDDGKIRERAHQLWEAAGRPSGRDYYFWQEAGKQLRDEQIKNETKTPDNL